MTTDYFQQRECDRCGRMFHPARYDARYCNDCGDNEWNPHVDENREVPDEQSPWQKGQVEGDGMIGKLAEARERLVARYQGKIREVAIEKAKVQITLHGRKVEDYSEDELEIIVADEEAKIRGKLKFAPLAVIAFLLGSSGSV